MVDINLSGKPGDQREDVRTMSAEISAEYFERHIARLAVVLYLFGEPVSSMFEGYTREIDSQSFLSVCDFWVREPGHLALALLHAYRLLPDRFVGNESALEKALDRMMHENRADTHRVALGGALFTPYMLGGELDRLLSFLVSRALASDRPSFNRSGTHRVVLETPGVTLAEKVLAECPSFGWYQAQCETVKTFLPILDTYDLSLMTYLAPDVTPMLASKTPLMPIILQRYTAAGLNLPKNQNGEKPLAHV